MEKKRTVALYARVSTDEQHTANQEGELKRYASARGWSIFKVYSDKGFSGAKQDRPALSELMNDARKRRFDIVLVWRFDRFARSLSQLIGALEEFRRLRMDFISMTENIDTSLPHGELVFQIMAALAQWERSLIAERVRLGLKAARQAGKQLGRPARKRLTPSEKVRIRKEWKAQRKSLRQLAAAHGVSVWQVYAACHEDGGRSI
jgi:DNA invertase Pin-like site-specific DNA recombinase